MENKNIQKIISVILLLVLLVSILPINNALAITPKNYMVNSTISARLDENGVLTVTGTGNIPDYTASQLAPWVQDEVKKIIINEGITRIGNYAFCELNELEEITFSNTIVSIGRYAFYGCESLTEFIAPNSLELIEASAFAECTAISNIKLNEGLKEIELQAFKSTKIKSLTIPSTLEEFASDACYQVLTLEEYKVTEGNKTFWTSNGALCRTPESKKWVDFLAYPPASILKIYEIPEGVTSIRNQAFQNSKNLEEIIIPDTVTLMNSYAFEASGIKRITIPDTKIDPFGMALFKDCTSLETVNIEAYIDETYGDSGLHATFENCTSLKYVNISSGKIKTIYRDAFKNCTSLEKIVIPEGTRIIEPSAFENCTSLKEVVWPSSISSVSETAFKGCNLLNQKYPEGFALKSDGYYRGGDIDLKVSGEYKYDKAKEVLEIVNEERSKEGLEPLKMDSELFETAQKRAAELAVIYSHTRPNRESCFTIFPDKGTIRGENIAAGNFGLQETPEDVMSGWMNSYGHRENILKEQFKYIGVGCFYHDGTYYWVQCFSDEGIGEMTEYPENETKQLTISTNSSLLTFSLNKKTIDMTTNEEETIKIYGEYDDEEKYRKVLADNDNFEWKSLNEEILTVENGVIKPKKPGTAVVQAISSRGDVLETTVNISDGDATISLNATEITIYEGETYKLEAIINSKYDDVEHEVKWTRQNQSYYYENVSVDQNGLVTGLRVGEATVTATLPNGNSASCKVKVKLTVPITSVRLNRTSMTLKEGETATLEAYIGPPETTYDRTLTWESSNPEVATVDKNGNVTAKSEGTAIITVTTTNGITATCNVTVEKAFLKGDIDNDGEITTSDLSYGLKRLTGTPITEDEIKRGDVTDDGEYTTSDLSKLLRYLTGVIDEL